MNWDALTINGRRYNPNESQIPLLDVAYAEFRNHSAKAFDELFDGGEAGRLDGSPELEKELQAIYSSYINRVCEIMGIDPAV